MKHTPAAASRFDPYSPLSGAVQVVVTGALTLIDPSAFRPGTRRVARGALSAATGVLVGAVWNHGMRQAMAEHAAQASESAERVQHQDASEPVQEQGASEPGRDSGASGAEDSKLAGTGAAIGIGGAMGVLTYGWMLLGEKIDAGIHRSLANRGVRHPRVVMALGAAGLTWVLFEVDRRTGDDDGASPAAGDTPSS
ncbi:hypothetical protein [Zhihengliuella halotolerans]|uniref:hypothetical protein n=1 Tax=Zhihengliuella halotolerans TaxID=370736 RepID=UPI000C7F9F25|nr:hypothetical protein [Zhihengliuella halotolerans]